ncbi:hypothetical protein BJ4_258 [Bacillus phage BJ4]|nr:hypothetical protein BJ4_258 [Bacillus phage BJ4]AOZ62510.1 hypothetical protein SBP8a_260 [Bacillus phage SBP8a]
MRFTDSLKAVNEKMGQNLVVSEALTQNEMIFGIEDRIGKGLSHIYMDVQEVVAIVKAFHSHFRKDVSLNKWIRDSKFSYMGYSDRTNIEIGRYRTTISELELQKLSILLEKWLTHKGVEFEGSDYKKEKITLKIDECKKDLQFFTNEKVSIISSMTSVTNDTVLDVLVCDLKEANRNIERLEKTLQDCIDRLSQF